jgi:hypothetical protein
MLAYLAVFAGVATVELERALKLEWHCPAARCYD